MSLKDDLVAQAQEYAKRNGLVLGDELGFGVHGIVFATESQPKEGEAPVCSAIKAHAREPDYLRERDIYLRLRTKGIRAIHACQVPKLLRYDDELLVIEMTVVSRPFLLDFAGAFLDKAPDFSEEVMADWRAEKLEQFGKRWPEVEAILRVLDGYGILVIDVTPNNISLPEV